MTGARLPEIFIVGTMKGGTTILYDYLCTHPRIVAGKQKEIHYFSLYPNKGLDWYLSHFPARPANVFSIDASPTYFDGAYMTTIPGYIKCFVPDARIILIVRDPIERAISHFHHLREVSHKELFANIDVNAFFSRPIERCYSQIDGYDFFLNQILSFSLYFHKYLYYTTVFDRSCILTLTNNELRAKPAETMRRVFAHCGLEWLDSELFGKQRYLSGSEKVEIDAAVFNRLANLFYPNYKKFCAAAGIAYEERPMR